MCDCDEVGSFINEWQTRRDLNSLSEAMIREGCIAPILRALGWDTANLDEVRPEHSLENRKVDYALLISSVPKVFIEVKRGEESLEGHQDQLLGYAFRYGVRLAALTNGAKWWFYLPLQEGNWDQRRFDTMDFGMQDNAEIACKLKNLLGRENVNSGCAFQYAENLQERNRILEALPKAWEQLVDDTIPNLLAERTQELCGHRPDQSTVEQFLSVHLQQVSMTLPPAAREATVAPEPTPQPNPSGRSERTTCKAFTFCGNRYKVSDWRDMLVKLCELIHTAHSDRFEEVLNLRGNNPYFSRNSSDLPTPRQIDGTDIFVNVSHTRQIKQIAIRLITHFGYDENDLSYEIQAL